MLKPGGRISVCFNSEEDLLNWPGHKFGFRVYGLEEVQDLLKSAGFEDVKAESAQDPKQGRIHCVSAVRGK